LSRDERHLSIWTGLLAVAGSMAAGCTEQVYAHNGLTAQMQVSGGQFYPGMSPPWIDGGVGVAGYSFQSGLIYPGEINWPLGGQLFPGAVAVLIQYEGDIGYWTVPANSPDSSYHGQVDFSTNVNFSRSIGSLPIGDAGSNIILQAIDADGGVGPPLAVGILLLSDAPVGPLVISLTWDTNADLDLHVVEPNGTEIWRNHQSDYTPGEGQPQNPLNLNSFVKYRNAYLDFDSNAQCVIDGRRLENVIWGPDAGIQKGTYTVRVDTFGMCGQSYAYWQVGAFVDGGQIAGATGESLKSDEAYFQHGPGAGVTAFTFQVP
jgi:hypothetical protein